MALMRGSLACDRTRYAAPLTRTCEPSSARRCRAGNGSDTTLPKPPTTRTRSRIDASEVGEAAQVHGSRVAAQARGQEDPDRHEREGTREVREQARQEEGIVGARR